MITIKTTQRSKKLNVDTIKSTVAKILNLLKYENFDIGIWFTTNATIRKYNRDYRKKDKPTDILSFSFHENHQAGKRIIARTPDDQNLGDLIISVEFIIKAAQELNQTFEHRLQVLLVHGILHLLGYDHIEDQDYKKMHRQELKLIKELTADSK